MDNASIKKNYILNIILVVFNTSFPLLTAPYISRILGANNLGAVNYSYSVISMFIVFAGFGIPIYGIRGVAKYKEDRDKLSNFISNILLLSILLTIFVSIFYLLFINYFSEDIGSHIWYIMFLSLVFFPLSFDWFFVGYENFQYVTIRTVTLKIISLLLMLIFVKEDSDYLIYAYILILTQVLTFFINFYSSKKYWDFKFVPLNLSKYIKESSVFFLTMFISSLFTTFDKVLVGIFSNNTAVALYFRNRQITMMVIGITTSLILVLTPRLSNLVHNKNSTYYIELLKKSYKVYVISALPISLGLVFLGKEILFLFGGIEFVSGYHSFLLLSIWVIFAGFNVFLDNQISIPNNKERFTTYICIIIASLTISFNIFLTPRFGIIGASISLLIAEFIGVIIHSILLYINNLLKIKLIDKDIIKILSSSIIMFMTLNLIKILFEFSFYINLIVFIPTGIFIYITSLILFKIDLVSDTFKILLSKLSKKEVIK
jgi:O-antigen/teichoic acid export membrane protein